MSSIQCLYEIDYDKYIYAQIVDDKAGKTLVFVSDLKTDGLSKKERAYEVGKQLAVKALKLKIKKVNPISGKISCVPLAIAPKSAPMLKIFAQSKDRKA